MKTQNRLQEIPINTKGEITFCSFKIIYLTIGKFYMIFNKKSIGYVIAREDKSHEMT